MAERFDGDIRELKTVLTRVELTVEKLTAVSQQLSELMSVQVSRFSDHERRLSEVDDDSRELRDDIHEIRNQLATLNTEMKVQAAHAYPLRKGAYGMIAILGSLLLGAVMTKLLGGKVF